MHRDETELRRTLLDELEALARGGQARELRGRLRPDLAGEGPDAEALDAVSDKLEGAAPEGAEAIPGVEEEEGAGSSLDESKLRALLASMRG